MDDLIRCRGLFPFSLTCQDLLCTQYMVSFGEWLLVACMASDPAGQLLPKLGDRGPVRCMAPDLVGLGSSGVQDVVR